MPRLGGLLRSTVSSARSSTNSLTALSETQSLEDAMRGTMFILNDDLDTAERLLSEKDDTFHKVGFRSNIAHYRGEALKALELGKAVCAFFRAILAMEHDDIQTAVKLLSEAETAALADQRRVQNDPNAFRSKMYAPGTEFEFCVAQAQVMSAIVAVLSESVTEAVKGFYRVRKAYMTLDKIMNMEKAYAMRRHALGTEQAGGGSKSSLDSAPGSAIATPMRSTSSLRHSLDQPFNGGDSDEDDFVDAAEEMDDLETPTQEFGNINLNQNTASFSESPSEVLDPSDLTTPLDIFIHSGVSLYAGMLQLLLSLIPPTFGKLLSIIGFRGDRDRGLAMLWRASAYPNINGAVASLTVLGYYTGLVSMLDILPSSGPGAYPAERCRALLKDLLQRHPQSVLCIMQDVRMMTTDRDLTRAVTAMESTKRSKLKQLNSLQYFENSLNLMYLHRYQACADGFIKCTELSNWSKAMYFYIAGCCHVELYRLYKHGSSSVGKGSSLLVSKDLAKAKHHAERAASILGKVREHAGKKKIFARQLPFDTFVLRKITKWEARSSARNIDLIDAVGVSPIEEMIFFWGGYGRMAKPQLEDSLAALTGTDAAIMESQSTMDEQAAGMVLQGIVFRHLGSIEKSQHICEDVINRYKWEEFRKVKDGEMWPAPIARYEMAVNWWLSSNEGKKAAQVGATMSGVGVAAGNNLSNREKLQNCRKYLDEVARWEAYDLDVRFGTRVSTGRETLAKLGIT